MSDHAPVVLGFDFSRALVATRQEVREMIAEVEELMKAMPEQLDIQHVSLHSGSVYAREIAMPAGAIISGKIHKHATMNFLMKGVVNVFSQDGCVQIKAPHYWVSTPGAKRIIHALEDSVWVCTHGTTETDEAKIEEEFIAKDYSEVVELKNSQTQLEGTDK